MADVPNVSFGAPKNREPFCTMLSMPRIAPHWHCVFLDRQQRTLTPVNRAYISYVIVKAAAWVLFGKF